MPEDNGEKTFDQRGPLSTVLMVAVPGLPALGPLRSDPSSLKCIAALAEYDRLNSDAGQLIPGRGERMEDYFKLRIKPHDDGSCYLDLDPKINANHWRPDSLPPDASDNTLIKQLRDRLETLAISSGQDGDKPPINVQAFSYALSPRLRRDYAVHESEDSTSLVSWLGTKLGLASRGTLTGETSDADIVGYVPPAPDDGNKFGLPARFGWVLGPQRNGPTPWERGLSVQQAELGALVAVPSWWRTVLLRVCTQFVKDSDLAFHHQLQTSSDKLSY